MSDFKYPLRVYVESEEERNEVIDYFPNITVEDRSTGWEYPCCAEVTSFTTRNMWYISNKKLEDAISMDDFRQVATPEPLIDFAF